MNIEDSEGDRKEALIKMVNMSIGRAKSAQSLGENLNLGRVIILNLLSAGKNVNNKPFFS